MGIMQSLLKGREKPLIGLDISSSAVKLLELSRRGGRYVVEAYATESLPPGAVNDRQIADVNAVGEVIARVVGRSGTKTRRVAAAVSGASVISKIIPMSASMTEADLEEQVKVEADQYIPYPVDEVSMDFEVIGPTAGTDESVDVLLVACRRQQVETLAAALEIGGLEPGVIDIEAYALENACQFLRHQMPELGTGKTIAVVDLGDTTTTMNVLHDMDTVFTREQAFGGRQLTEEIARTYAMGFEEAGKAKRFGGLPDSYQDEVLRPFLEDLAQQIDRSLQFYFANSNQTQEIHQLILAGGCAHIAGIAEHLSEKLRLQTVVASPFSNMTVTASAKPALLAREEAAMLVALGLAWRSFDGVR
jgi:type IV pilus assembly protein PilM